MHLDNEWAAGSFSTLLGDRTKGAAWIVSDGPEPAGYVVLTLRHSMEYGGQDAFIDDLYVRPRYRRQGLGRAALSALFADCEQRELSALHVEVSRNNPAAQALYRSFGLSVVDDARQTLTARFGASIGHKRA